MPKKPPEVSIGKFDILATYTTITAESFDHQVSDKMGGFFGDVFLPNMKKLVQAGLSYDEVKTLLKIPATWGAKISGEQFRERASKFEPK